MTSHPILSRLEIWQGDITTLALDAIVNAANSSLLGGGGVDGAIHRAAGPKLLEACRKIGGCRTGEAVITPGFLLPARHVIHTVGPVWQGGGAGEAELLASCYTNSLRLASAQNLATVGFPAISTGVYRYPADQATAIAVHTVAQFLGQNDIIQKVVFIAFNENTAFIYRQALDILIKNSNT